MESHSLGEQELEVLRYLADHAPITAGDVAEGFGQERGLARTTVLTVIERLRQKKYVTRKRRGGLFYYAPRVPKHELLQQLVQQFVRRTLAGSVSPFVAYLAREHSLTKSEFHELECLVEALKAQQDDTLNEEAS